MKINTAKKMIVAAMVTAMGAGIAGSISGTVAWYQYSTRATTQYQGAAAHSTENLVLATAQNGQYSNKLGNINARSALRPVTSGTLAEGAVAAKLYKNPIYQYQATEKWGEADATHDFVEFDIWAKVEDLDGTGASYLAEKPIYLTDVTIEAVESNTKADISEAVRVAVYYYDNTAKTGWATYSKTGAAVDVYGALDLNQDGQNDKAAKYSFETQGNDIVYGDANKQAASYATNALAADDSTTKIADDSNPYSIKGKALATTGANGAAVHVCTIRVYLEGWTKINNVDPTKGTFANIEARDAATAANVVNDGIYKVTDAGQGQAKWYKAAIENEQVNWTEVANPVSASSIWSLSETIDAQFNVGLQFSTTVHEAH